MKQVFRIDHGTLRKPERTPQGFLRVDGYVARPGIYEYRNTAEDAKDGYGAVGTIRRELRSDEEAFSARTLAGYDGAPITVGHPRRPNGDPEDVTAENVRAHEVGNVGGIGRRDGDLAAVTLYIKDAKAIKRVESGLQELSPGYRTDLEKKSGVDPKYGRYDAVQSNITINHLALVGHARGGSNIRLRMDEAMRTDDLAKMTSAVDGHQHLVNPCSYDGTATMSGETSYAVADGANNGHTHPWICGADGVITIGESAGHAHTILDDAAMSAARGDEQIDRFHGQNESQLMKTDQQRADEAEGTIVILNKRITELEGLVASGAAAAESDALKQAKTRTDEAESNVRKLETAFKDAVKGRAKLEREAISQMGTAFRTDDLSDRQIHEAVVKRLDHSADVKSVNDDVLRGQYTALLSRSAANASSQERVGEIIGRGTETRRVDEKSERDKRSDDYRNQWKKTLNGRDSATEGR